MTPKCREWCEIWHEKTMQTFGQSGWTATLGLFVFLTVTGMGTPDAIDIQGPVFVQEPPDHVDFSNTTGTSIVCSVRGVPRPTVTWVMSTGDLLPTAARLREVHPNGTLIFFPFEPEEYRQDVHAAVYRCQATNAVGTIISRNVHVRAVVKQYYEVHVYGQFVIRGNIAVFMCNIPSFVKDYVEVTAWVRDGPGNSQQLILSGGRYSVHSTGELYIRNAQESDGGRDVSYRCKTQHRLTGESKLSATAGHLTVTESKSSVPPRITHIKNLVSAEVGVVTELPCVAQGFPLPNYRIISGQYFPQNLFGKISTKLLDYFLQTQYGNKQGPLRYTKHVTVEYELPSGDETQSWYREGSSSQKVVIDGHFQLNGGSLQIHNVKISDAGTYHCVVNNTVGEEKVEVEFKVTAPLIAFIEPQKQVIDVGKSASFRCVFSGFPITDVVWLKDARPLLNSPRIRYPTRDSLHIQSIQREDRGMYQCFVTSGHKTVQATTELQLGDAKPQLLQTFEARVLKSGSAVSLFCVASGNPPPQIRWTIDGIPIQSSDRHFMEQQISLHGDVISYVNISNVQPEDGGEYKCSSSNQVGHVQHTARIDVYGPPYIRPMQNVSAVSGSSWSIRCLVTGYPVRSITWEKDGTTLPINHRQKVFPNGTLIVHNAQRATDAGLYMCLAKGDESGSTARGNVFVTVMNPPKISPFSFPRDIQEGMRATITCSVFHGDLPISVSWLKDGRSIHPTAELFIRGLDDLTTTLVVQHITPKDNGNYTCVAQNAAAVVNYTAQLLVLVPPHWIHEPKDSSVISGKTIIIDCQSDGIPPPTVTWKKAIGRLPGEYVPIDYSSGRNYLYPNGSLLLTSVQETDAGYYLCQSNNSVGAGLSKVILLKVHAPAHFEEKFRNQTVRRGHEAVLSCESKGDVPMTIEWRINNQRIDMRKKYKYSIREEITSNGFASRLIISRTSREDTTEFSCLASNDYGKDKAWIYLIVQEPPEAPQDVKVILQNSRAVSVSWMPSFSGNSKIMQYIIQVKAVSSFWIDETKNISIASGETSAVVVGLKPAVEYAICVAAENIVGIGPCSNAVKIVTAQEVPDGPPLNVIVEAIGSQSLKIQWEPPKRENWNGEITGYRIEYRKYDTAELFSVKTTDIKKENHEQLVLENLMKFTKYSIIIQAFNKIGIGPKSREVIGRTMEDVPSQPPRGIKCSPSSSQSLALSWSPPPPQSLNGILRGFRVVYKPVEEYNVKSKLEFHTTSLPETELQHLEKYTNYSIQVQAFTMAGDGAVSTAVYCRTKEDVPGPPAGIKVLPMSSDAIIVSWIPPNKPNGIITKYTVYMRVIDDYEKSASSFTLPPNQFYYETRGLNENMQYEFCVKASTAVGEGEKTTVIANSPVSTVPARIASFSQMVLASRKDDVNLPCRAVGIPTPDRDWFFKGKHITGNNRIQILPDGTLHITSYRITDAGNYSCKVQNIYAKEEIFHSVMNKLHHGDEYPPSPPILKITARTTRSITLTWKWEEHDDLPITGLTLNYKTDIGKWEEIQIESKNTYFTLDRLLCGTRYHLRMITHNRAGSSEPSETKITTTNGNVPDIPERDTVLEVNSTFVIVHLPLWPNGGCSISQFLVEYKEKDSIEWISVTDKISPLHSIIISDLNPGVHYTLRVTAVNSAGSTPAEYEFVTLKTHNGDFSEEKVMEKSHGASKFYLDLNTLIPVSLAIVVIIVVLILLCVLVRRRHYNGYLYTVRSVKKSELENAAEPSDMVQKTAAEVASTENHSYDQAYTPAQTRKTLEINKVSNLSSESHDGSHDEISPYATFQLPGVCYSDEADVHFHTFGYDASKMTDYPPSPQFQYTKVRKKPLFHSHPVKSIRGEGIPMNVRSSASKEQLNPLHTATLKKRDTECNESYSTQTEPIIPSAPPAESDSTPTDSDTPDIAPSAHKKGLRTLNYVPDILDHRPDSSTSNETTPDMDTLPFPKREKNGERMVRPCRVSLRAVASIERCSSPESATDDASFTFHKPKPPPGFTDGHYQQEANASSGVASSSNQDQNPKSPSGLAAVEEELIALLKRGGEQNTLKHDNGNSYYNINV